MEKIIDDITGTTSSDGEPAPEPGPAAAPEPAPEPEPSVAPEPAPEPEAADRERDDKGRFVAKDTGEGKAAPEPEPASDVKPEAGAEPPEPEMPKSDTVPIGTLTHERKRFQAENQELRDKMTRMETLFGEYKKGQAPAPDANIPAYEDDPEGHLRASIEQMQEKLVGFEQRDTDRQAQEATFSQEQQLMDQYANSVRTFSATHADFQDAYNHLAKEVDADLIARGIDDPVERANVIQYEEGMLVGRALKAGKDPAELIYSYAKSRGYAGNGAGSAPAAPGGAPVQETEEDKLARLEKGAAAAKSLSGTPGTAQNDITLERLAELANEDGEAFDAEWEKAKRKGLLG